MKLRPLFLAGLAAGLAGPAIAQSCLPAAERTAFEVRALQSQLMVAALACQRDNDYNAFVRRFQGELGAAYRSIDGHFRRTAGGGATRERDAFITTLANVQSQDGIRQGSQFCPTVTPLFQLALAQPNAAALADLSMDRNVLNPQNAPACAANAPAAASARSSGQRSSQRSNTRR
jgi:hypothetical protein